MFCSKHLLRFMNLRFHTVPTAGNWNMLSNFFMQFLSWEIDVEYFLESLLDLITGIFSILLNQGDYYDEVIGKMLINKVWLWCSLIEIKDYPFGCLTMMVMVYLCYLPWSLSGVWNCVQSQPDYYMSNLKLVDKAFTVCLGWRCVTIPTNICWSMSSLYFSVTYLKVVISCGIC